MQFLHNATYIISQGSQIILLPFLPASALILYKISKINHVQLETWTFPTCRTFLALIPQPLLPWGEGESDSKSLSLGERDLG